MLPALGSGSRAEPIVFIHGGPGLAATQADAYVNWALAPERNAHDLIMVDMRGTGDHNPLTCNLYEDNGRIAPYLEPMFPLAKVRDCALRLSTHADLTQYTTENAARDLDDVRASLRIDQWSLFGGSYGTRLALEYMRLFPTRVRRAALLGVLPPEVPIGRDFARGGQMALDSAFAACAAQEKCRTEVPDARGDVAALLAQLRRAPAQLDLWNSRRLRREHVAFTARAAAEGLFVEAYDPTTLLEVLPFVHRALHHGEVTALAQLLAKAERARRTAGRREGVTLSVFCTEDAPRLQATDTVESEGMLGIPGLPELVAACGAWPHGVPPPDFARRVVSTIPTLLMSGGRDPATPSYLADSAAAGLAQSERYLNPATGHAFLDEQARARMASFFQRRRNQ